MRLRTCCIWDVLDLRCFGTWVVLQRGRFQAGTLCLWTFFYFGRFQAGTLCLGMFFRSALLSTIK